MNVGAGIRHGVLHAEDVPLYGSKNTIPNRDKVLKLHKLCKKFLNNVCWSHASMAAVAADPKLVKEVSEILLNGNQEWWGAEVGIETGSPELVRKVMPAKASPFRAEDWPEVVKKAAGVMADSNLVPACTLVVGLPQETDEDILKTIELVEDLKDFESLIVPLFFIPMGKLKDENWFSLEGMSPLHKELLLKCLRHSLHWTKKIMARSYFKGRKGPFLNFIIRLLVWWAEQRTNRLEMTLRN